MNYRALTSTEIAALKDQGCFSSSWSNISVTSDFSTGQIHHVRFQGNIKLGKVTGLYNSKICNCEIGNRVLIDGVHLLENYQVEEDVTLENVDTLVVEGPASFGNGTEIEVLNEGGGRELLMFDQLTAQIAYMLVAYRHDPELIQAINEMIDEHVKKRTAEKGTIGTAARVLNAGSIYNVNIGAHVNIQGASLLKNGTIVSNHHAPVSIGENVVARDFMILSGSKLDGGAMLQKCFIGQGVEVGKQFSAENTLFFANSEAFHGEAVSVFGGPYTVTHHKSTLLIAGMFSFYNAGSGTNQSNHMYKLGPVHQGIMERGSKTGSFAYLLWPTRIGAFSVVMGKNLASFDSSDFPFSYINVDQDRSILTPGMNLFTVGTRRDSQKWPTRDKRTDPEKWDLINFEFLSPYIMQKVISSLDILKGLYEKASQKQETVFYKGIRIKRLMLKSTRKYYEMAMWIFIGNQVLKKLEAIKEIHSIETLQEAFSAGDEKAGDRWVDMAGMIAPDQAVKELISKVKSRKVDNLDSLSEALKAIHQSFEAHAWDWTKAIMAERYGMDKRKVDTAQIIELISKWETESIKLDKMILNDAGKEYDEGSKIGFGIDGEKEVTDMDFEHVRGTAENNKFIIGINQEIREISERAELQIGRLYKIQAGSE